MRTRRTDTFLQFLRRFPVRQKILAMVGLLAFAMMIPIPLSVIGQERLLGEQQRITQVLVDSDRLLLLASARIAASQANLLRYLQGETPTLEIALADADEALSRLDVARSLVPTSAQVAQVEELRLDMAQYLELIGQVQAASLTGTSDDAGDLGLQALDVADALSRQIEGLVGVSQQAVDDANRALRASARRSLLFAVVGQLVAVAGVLTIAMFASRSITAPIETLRGAAERLGQGDLDVVVPETGQDEFSFLARVFNGMTVRLAESYRNLEQRVVDRTADLEQRSQYMRAVINVSRATTDIQDPDALVQRSVELIRQRFDLTYVGLFLVDAGRRAVVLRAGTGEAGEAMLSRGHQLAFGQGMVGWSVANARPRVSLEASQDMMRVVNPYLPQIRSEAAIPLRVRGRVIGALTVQDNRPDVFNQEMIELLQVMGDLLAVAIENARLLSEVQTSLDVAQQAYGQLSREGWLRVLQGRARGYASGSRGQGPVSLDGLYQAWQTGDAVIDDRTLSVPIVARGISLGAMRLTKAGTAWTAGETALVQTVVDQLGLALDSARLYEDTQIRAARERVAREITDNMRATVDWEDLMQTAVHDIGEAVQASRIFIQWLPPDGNGLTDEIANGGNQSDDKVETR